MMEELTPMTTVDIIIEEKKKQLLKKEEQDIQEQIIALIAEYDADKFLLRNKEQVYKKMELEYGSSFHVLKTQFLAEGYKSTEAKEQANEELIQHRLDLIRVEQEISELKAEIKVIEYQLRLKLLEYGEQNKYRERYTALLEERV